MRLPENLVGRFVAAMEWCMINLLLKHWFKEEMMLAKLFQVAFAGLLLAGCAMTPQQRAAYEAAREREMKQTAVALAAQCDRRTAELLALQQEDYLGVADAEKPKLQREYRRRIAEPSFQACYRMACENLVYRQQLEMLERRERRRELEWMMYRPYYPYWW